MIETKPKKAAIQSVRLGSGASTLLAAPIAKSSVKMNNPAVFRIVLSRSSMVAIIRGVSCPLATWIATSIDPNVKTTKASVNEMID